MELNEREIHRCAWANPKNPLYLAYHDEEWGRPLHEDRALFELLILECFQAGLSWECILNKRDAFREAYEGFVPSRVAAFTDEKIQALLQNPGIVRNKLKVRASVTNAQVFLAIQKEFGSFDNYLWSYVGGKPLIEDYHVRTTSPLSDEISRDLKRRGMKFVGSTVVYSYLQASGVINAHGSECDLCPASRDV